MSTALYRRYRPETFADVIGQGHVTDPLMAALRSDRITHAYLFSGPRGCGKTTSARIFARCLNCAQGPTDTPCGTCPSCLELARDGAGSLDVVEMDAASHGGVDDARELRERAAFAPARDRYKIFIIDEAHMVTSQGFNALLKLVEEPPAHVKFVFATTEPEKVIGTIRSRTHHYPFRLVPPERLQGYLEELCAAEGVSVATGVLPLVVRAGGGSVRDSLSVLDQLIAGAQDGEVGYERAVALLGYTHAALLDDVVDVLAARDGASLFRVVDRVIDSGHDPRRFAEDLLERLRDLVLIAVSGEHAAAVLRALPSDQFERMRVQSQQLGPAELSRAGDLVNDALTEMSGATSPRLQLELLCARLLLPGADDGARGHGARLERIERHLASGGGVGTQRPDVVASPAAGSPEPMTQQRDAGATSRGKGPVGATSQPARGQDAPGGSVPLDGAASAVAGQAAERSSPAGQVDAPEAGPPDRAASSGGPPGPVRSSGGSPDPVPSSGGSPDPVPSSGEDVGSSQPEAAPSDDTARRPPEWQGAPAGPAEAAGGPPAPASTDAELIRRRWPEVLATLARFKRSTWTLVSQNSQVADVSGGVLHLAFTTSGLAHTFRSGPHAEPLQRALLETLGVQVRIEPVLSQSAEGGQSASNPHAASGRGDSAPSPSTSDWSIVGSGGGAAWSSGGDVADGSGDGTAATPVARPGGAPSAAPSPVSGSTPATSYAESAQSPDGPGAVGAEAAATPGSGAHVDRASGSGGSAVSPRSAESPASTGSPGPVARVSVADDTPSMDDPDAENSGLAGAQLIERMLGGKVISEE